jgi:phosphatidylglycerol:prolipoprotein diacylglycerol transferase
MDYIRFPYLWGLELHIKPIAFSIGDFVDVYWYGLIIAAGFLTAAVLAFRACVKHGIKTDDLIDYVIFGLPAAIVGARLYYVIFAPNAVADYWSQPLEILKIWKGGLAIYGGIIAVVITVLAVAWYKKQNPLRILDFALPYVLLGQAIGRWGNFTNQEAFGANTFNILGMTGNRIKLQLEVLKAQGVHVSSEIPVHPTFLYESLWCIVGFALLMIYRKRFKKFDGDMLLLYLLVYGSGRAWIEGLRLDSLAVGTIRVSQVLSIAIAALAAVLFAVFRFRRAKKASAGEGGLPEEEETEGQILLDEESMDAAPIEKDEDSKKE